MKKRGFSTLLLIAFLTGNFPPFVYAQEISNNIRTMLSSRGKAIYGDESNSIMVIDYPENIERVAEFLAVLDVPPQQVLIEARVVEVKLQKEHALGVNWKALADKGYFPMGRFKLGTAQTTASAVPLLGTAAPAPFTQNIGYKPTFFPPLQSAAGQESPFSLAIFDDNIHIVLQTLANALDSNILSAPKVTTVNNRQAEIKVIQKLPWAEPTLTVEATSGAVSVTWKINFEEVGIILKATPTINENGNITLELSPEVSEKTSDFSLTVTQGSTSVPYTIPIIDKRSASTKVIVGDGQTLIMGGLIKDKTTHGETKVPLLGDIPFLGYLFKSKKDTRDKTELLIFVSPRIITPDEIQRMSGEEKALREKDYLKQRQKEQETALKQEKEKEEKQKGKEIQSELLRVEAIIEREKK